MLEVLGFGSLPLHCQNNNNNNSYYYYFILISNIFFFYKNRYQVYRECTHNEVQSNSQTTVLERI